MQDQEHIAPQYEELVTMTQRRQVTNAVSDTQAELMELTPGERWAHEAASQHDDFPNHGNPEANNKGPLHLGENRNFTVTQAGNNVVDNAELPDRIEAGITTEHEVTDRRLDHDGEFGYPTPS